MSSPWRLIPLINAPGLQQMAIDYWLFQQHCQGLHPPTLRFYTWEPAAISLGYHQRHYPQFWHNLTWNNQPIDIIRRPTGGRAVLHQGDLTYAVIGSGFSEKRTIAYQQICEFLIQGWRDLGINLTYGTAGRGYIHNPNCFATSTGADLVTETGIKLIGSAQQRQGSVILQHGSIQLNCDQALFTQVFQIEPSPKLNFPFAASLETAIPMITQALIASASHCFKAQFFQQPLTQLEWQEILELEAPTAEHKPQ